MMTRFGHRIRWSGLLLVLACAPLSSTDEGDAELPEAPDDPGASVLAEADLVEELRKAMESRDSTRTLVLVAKHRRDHPDSWFESEREKANVLALCGLGRIEQADSSFRDYLRQKCQRVETPVRADCPQGERWAAITITSAICRDAVGCGNVLADTLEASYPVALSPHRGFVRTPRCQGTGS